MLPSHTIWVVRAIGLFVVYAYVLWRLFKDNPGNRLIQCGSITLMVFLVMAALAKANVPLDYWTWLGPALFLLCLVTMFFLFQRMYRALFDKVDRSSSKKTQ